MGIPFGRLPAIGVPSDIYDKLQAVSQVVHSQAKQIAALQSASATPATTGGVTTIPNVVKLPAVVTSTPNQVVWYQGSIWQFHNGVWQNLLNQNFSSTAQPVTAAPGTTLTPQGVPSTVTPAPAGTPTVSVLPGTGDPLSVVGNYIIIPSGIPGIAGTGYYFRPPLTGVGAGYWYQDTTQSPSISDTFANLGLYPAANYTTGTVFLATDRNISFSVQVPSPTNVATWLYFNGIHEDLLANIPLTLGVNDTGYYFRASDYLHNWKWTGTAWSLLAAAQSGFQGGATPGTLTFSLGGPPFGGTGALWHLCDGTNQNVSQEDATVVLTTLPTIANTWFAR